ncbi:hypothetical protein [Methanobrevibacter arboriphilus]|uniref:hypothetical protein n=1 Tax=Methanobrevibacter arboriphilus TaxID=39441 RepID=UPI000AE8913F|nr:hypothetical protein [Methanobrevibacter arboriphilus]
MSDEKKGFEIYKKRESISIVKKTKKITITNNLEITISQFYQKDDDTIKTSSKSMKIKDGDIIYEIFSNGIILKIEEREKKSIMELLMINHIALQTYNKKLIIKTMKE